jgi:hypothetical protein
LWPNVPDGEDGTAEVKRAVHLSYLLDGMAKAISNKPTPIVLREMVEVWSAKRPGNWMEIIGKWFEVAKFLTIENGNIIWFIDEDDEAWQSGAKRLYSKRPEVQRAIRTGLNVAEASVSDMQEGYHENGQAGLAVAHPIAADDTYALELYKDAYMSWNLAFVSSLGVGTGGFFCKINQPKHNLRRSGRIPLPTGAYIVFLHELRFVWLDQRGFTATTHWCRDGTRLDE